MASEASLDEAVTLLKSLIAIPSLSRDEGKAADFLEQRLKSAFLRRAHAPRP